MLMKTTPREAIDIAPIVTDPVVSGVALVLGNSPDAIEMLTANPKVTRVILVGGEGGVYHPKMVSVAGNPFTIQRRDLLVGAFMASKGVKPDRVDYLFCDLSDEPWELERSTLVRDRVREFRPIAAGYRWQELDIAANWVATGGNLDAITARAIPSFAFEEGIPVHPQTTDYAKRCADMAGRFIGVSSVRKG